MTDIELFCDFWSCALYTSFFIFLFYHIRKRLMKMSLLSVRTICFIYLLCLIRLLIPFEAPWSVCIGSDIFNPIINFLFFYEYHIGSMSLHVHHLLLFTYATISALLLIKMVVVYISVFNKLRLEPISNCKIAYEELEKIKSEHSSPQNIKIYELNAIASPFSLGIINKCIILPQGAGNIYSREEMHFIIKHEYNHLINHDCLIKLLSNVAVCLFFWNPCVYIFRRDLEQSLELRCDHNTLKNVSALDRIKYLETMLYVLKSSNAQQVSPVKERTLYALTLVSNIPISLKERFTTISNPTFRRNFTKDFSIVIIACIMFIASYSVFFSAKYDPPHVDIEPCEDSHELNPITDTLVISDSTCYVICEDGFQLEVPNIYINIWKKEGGNINYEEKN